MKDHVIGNCVYCNAVFLCGKHVFVCVCVSGVIAVAMTERFTLEERIDNSTKLLLNPSYILFWSLSDPINPQVIFIIIITFILL